MTSDEECTEKGRLMDGAPQKVRSTRFSRTALGPTCSIELNDDRIVTITRSAATANGDEILFNCFRDLKVEPLRACDEMFSSIQLED